MPAAAAIYLDANAGVPLKPEASAALRELLDRAHLPHSANPSSIHSHGRSAKRLLADAREKIANSIGQNVDHEQLVFTSSGTEANQLAIRSLIEPVLLAGSSKSEKVHWITTPVEHDATLQLIEWTRKRGGAVDFLPVDAQGRPLVSELARLWKPETKLVSCVWANNETGVINDVAALIAETKRLGGKIHLDAAQAWGKIPLDVVASGADLVTFSAHKIGALAGLGLVWVGRGTPLSAVIPGKQEKGRRGGSENLAGIITAGAAAGTLDPIAWASRVEPLRDRLETEILARIPGATVNGAGAPRVPNTLNLTFDGVEGDGLVMALDLAGYSVSSGSACSSGVLEPSHVLLALGRSRAQSMAAVRVSLVDELPWEILEGFICALEKAVSRVRQSILSRIAPNAQIS
jgi:cysteine desulfurase